jgi:hypothetical protein
MLGSGGGNERWPLGLREAHALGQDDAKAVEEHRLGGIGLCQPRKRIWPLADIRAQEIGAHRERCPIVERCIVNDAL